MSNLTDKYGNVITGGGIFEEKIYESIIQL